MRKPLTIRSSEATNEGDVLKGVCSGACARVRGHGDGAGCVPQVRAVCCFNSAGGMNTNRWEKIPWLLRPLLWFFLNVLLNPEGAPACVHAPWLSF